ncbi:hypothetical protein [Paraburkholderia caribensis]|uniref:hypothetical protein n=1 Tax=Paraburkholderia caribensis TaxID=75105 RepID=UPI001CC40FC1|nr:hypothetical protein [Paraburkholderia caribensis]
MNAKSVREQSLSYHLALATCRIGHGNNYLFNELMRTVYIAWFLQQAGFGDEPVALYKLAEYSVETALTLANESGEWLLADEALPAFEKLLALHDSQLAVAPLHKVVDAEQQLSRYLCGTASSPIPEGD